MPRAIIITDPNQGSGDICFRCGDAILILYLFSALGTGLVVSSESAATLTTDIIGNRSSGVPHCLKDCVNHKFNRTV